MSKPKPPKTIFVTLEQDKDETYFNTQEKIEHFQFDDEPVRIVHEYRLVNTQEVRRVLHCRKGAEWF